MTGFAERAAQLAGMAGAVLGWSPDVFWAATSAELAAVVAALVGDEDATPADAVLVARLQEAFPDG